jgi:hypothetical protein
VAAESEAHLARQIEEVRLVDWSEPPAPIDADGAAILPDEVIAMLDELDRLAEARSSVTFHEFLPWGTASESLLRATLLPLLGQQTGGAGVAGRLAALGLSVFVDGDGTPLPARLPLAELTPGRIETIHGDSPHG